MTIASFDNGKATIVLEYNDATMRGTALVGTNNTDKTMQQVTFEKNVGSGGASGTIPPGGERRVNLPPGGERRVNLPNGLQLGIDSETGEASITGAGHNVRVIVTLG